MIPLPTYTNEMNSVRLNFFGEDAFRLEATRGIERKQIDCTSITVDWAPPYKDSDDPYLFVTIRGYMVTKKGERHKGSNSDSGDLSWYDLTDEQRQGILRRAAQASPGFSNFYKDFPGIR